MEHRSKRKPPPRWNSSSFHLTTNGVGRALFLPWQCAAIRCIEAPRSVAGGGPFFDDHICRSRSGSPSCCYHRWHDKTHFGLAFRSVHENRSGHLDFLLLLIFPGNVTEQLHKSPVPVTVHRGAGRNCGQCRVIPDLHGPLLGKDREGRGLVCRATCRRKSNHEADGETNSSNEKDFFHEGRVNEDTQDERLR